MMFLFFPFLPCLYCPLIYSMSILCVFPTEATCLWPAGEPGVPFLAISCPSLLFLLEECFCIFLTGINRLVLDRFVRQRVHNYGHDMYINNTHWLIETCLFVCNVGINIYIYIYTWEWICIIISISIYIYINTIRHWNIWIGCVAVILSALVLCVPQSFFGKNAVILCFSFPIYLYDYVCMYVCMNVM